MTRTPAIACLLLASISVSCASPFVPPDYEHRMAAAEGGLEGDLAVKARRADVQAAIARERSETPLEEVELRVRNEYDDDSRLRVTTRLSVPNPAEMRARHELRRSDTSLSLARLEETALDRKAERCFASVESAAHRGQLEIYVAHAQWQQVLLEWNEEWRQSGSQSETTTTRFEIESRIKLARRRPGPPPQPEGARRELPAIGPGPGRLVRAPGRIREKLREHSPSVAIHEAVARRYRALTARAQSRLRPWIDFVDFSYEPVARDSDNEVGMQVALRIPFGAKVPAEVNRYRALGRSETWERRHLVEQQMYSSRVALHELDYFESSAEQWRELVELATRAEALAEQRWQERLLTPSQIAGLFEQAYKARIAVLEARERAGMASCRLLAMTGIPLEDWPRE